MHLYLSYVYCTKQSFGEFNLINQTRLIISLTANNLLQVLNIEIN